ncbi:hypothetical protein ACGF4C_39150 [Streptomyces sp. NPDC048197]|uniref:hypothetical protein n=1 Tax=Streptomyces sp. NPDC048197 TaxID=3365511 RepID=UPI00371B5B18
MLISPSSSCGRWWPLMSLGRSRWHVLDIRRPPNSESLARASAPLQQIREPGATTRVSAAQVAAPTAVAASTAWLGRAGSGGHNLAVDLRPELLPPPVSRQWLDELCTEVERIADLLEACPEVADEAIAAFNAMTGHDYEALDFAECYGSRSLEEFAREAARPACPVVADITQDELVEIVRRLLMAAPESDYYLRLLEANVSHPRVSDLVFHPSDALKNASAEQIVDEALKHRPIAL